MPGQDATSGSQADARELWETPRSSFPRPGAERGGGDPAPPKSSLAPPAGAASREPRSPELTRRPSGPWEKLAERASADGTGRREARGSAAGAAARWALHGAEPRARRTGAGARRPRLPLRLGMAPALLAPRAPTVRPEGSRRAAPSPQSGVGGRAGEPQRGEPGRPAGGVTCVRESWAAAAMVFPSCTGREGRTDGQGPGAGRRRRDRPEARPAAGRLPELRQLPSSRRPAPPCRPHRPWRRAKPGAGV